MRLKTGLAFLALSLVASAAPARVPVMGNYQSHTFSPPDPRLSTPSASSKRINYGKKHWQDISYFPAKGDEPAPLVIALCNSYNGWMRYRFNEAGYALAALPCPQGQMKAAEYYQTLVDAISYLDANSVDLGADMDRIILAGWGQGANDAVLFGTDPIWMDAAGVPFSNVKAVIAFHGLGFDIPRRVVAMPVRGAQYRRFYGKDEADQRKFSPVIHLDPPNAPAFLLMEQKVDRESFVETQEMAETLIGAGITATFVTLPDLKEGSLPTYFLADEKGSGKELMPFLRNQLEVPANLSAAD